MESVLKLDVPWNMLRHQLAHVLPDGRVDYSSCLDQYVIETGLHKVCFDSKSIQVYTLSSSDKKFTFVVQKHQKKKHF